MAFRHPLTSASSRTAPPRRAPSLPTLFPRRCTEYRTFLFLLRLAPHFATLIVSPATPDRLVTAPPAPPLFHLRRLGRMFHPRRLPGPSIPPHSHHQPLPPPPSPHFVYPALPCHAPSLSHPLLPPRIPSPSLNCHSPFLSLPPLRPPPQNLNCTLCVWGFVQDYSSFQERIEFSYAYKS